MIRTGCSSSIMESARNNGAQTASRSCEPRRSPCVYDRQPQASEDQIVAESDATLFARRIPVRLAQQPLAWDSSVQIVAGAVNRVASHQKVRAPACRPNPLAIASTRFDAASNVESNEMHDTRTEDQSERIDLIERVRKGGLKISRSNAS